MRRLVTICLISLLLIPGTHWVPAAYSQDAPEAAVGAVDRFVVPPTEIVGPNTPVAFGDLIDLRIKTIERQPEWLHSVSYSWTIMPNHSNVVVWPDNTRILFGTGIQAKRYTVLLTASYVFVVTQNDKLVEVAQRQATTAIYVDVGGTPPQPEPGPGPGPGPVPPPQPPPQPDPPTPVPELKGVAKLAYDWAGQVMHDPATKRLEAGKMVESFRTTSSQVAAGVIRDVPMLLRETKALNDLALAPPSREAWKPWFTELATKLGDWHRSGQVRTPAQYAEVWNGLATGLEYVAKPAGSPPWTE